MSIRQTIDHLAKRLMSRWRQFTNRSSRAKRADTDLAMAQVMGVRKTKTLPSKEQIKHLPLLLSKRERLIASVAILIILVAGFFLIRHLINAQRTTVPAVGGDYTEGVVGAPQLINPLYSSISDVDADLSRLIYSGLMTFDANEGLTTDLAESYEISEDGTQYTFVLREDVRWHDGQRVHAGDVVFTIRAIQNVNYRSPLAGSFEDVLVEQIDEQTVRFTLEESFAPFLSSLTVGILPSHIWQNIPPVNTTLTELNLKPIGSGPYRFEKLVKDSRGSIVSYTVVRNERYYDPAYLESITLKFYANTDDAIDALRNHNVQGVAFVPIGIAKSVEEHVKGRLMTSGMTQYTAAFFNQGNTILADEDVREALVLATDTQQIIDDALYGFGRPIGSFLLPGMLGYTEIQPVAQNISSAQERLISAGWVLPDVSQSNETIPEEAQTAEEEEENQEEEEEVEEEIIEEEVIDATVRVKDDVRLSFDLVTLNTAELVAVAELLKAQWALAGVEVTITAVDNATLHNDILENRSYDILLSGELYRIDPDLYTFWHSSQTDYPGLNISGYENSDVDEWIRQARSNPNIQERSELYGKIQEQIVSEAPAVFLYQPLYTHFIAENLRGVELTMIASPSDRFSQINEWYVKTRKVLGSGE